MPNLKTLTALIFATFLLAAFALPVFAVTYNPGVTTGQYVKYGNFVGTGPGFESFRDYDFLTLTITNVAGKEVTLFSTGQFKNGTAFPGTTSIWNVETGTENGVPSTLGTIVATNLNVGDPIPPLETYTVNSTENRQYLGVTRSVNILSVIISTPDYNSSLTYVYDKASGMLLESTSQTTVQAQPEPVTSEYSYSITGTNTFSSTPTNPAQNPPTIYILAAIITIIIVLAVVLLLLRKRI